MPRDMTCVYRAADVGEADIVAAWLADQGITVHVKNWNSAVNVFVPSVAAPKGIEVCVVDPAQVERAQSLIIEHHEQRIENTNKAASGRTIEAVCEECGKASRFSFEQRDTVQTCPHCRKYIDVPEA